MHEDEQTRLLRELISIDSANPPGNEERIAGYVADNLANQGIDSRLVPLEPGRASLYAELPGELPEVIGLSGHLDTVPASDEWTLPPTTPVLRNGRLYGLGATDMKGGVAMLLAAFCRVARAVESGCRLQRGLALLLSAAEETRLRGAQTLREAGLVDNVTFLIIGEPTNAELGIGSMGGVLTRVTFEGQEAHAATPAEGINAILACARFLLAMEQQVETLPVYKHSDDLTLRATLNVGTIAGGRATNIVAGQCHADLDMRCASQVQEDSYFGALAELAEKAAAPGTYQSEVLYQAKPLLTPETDPWIARFARAYESVVGHHPTLGVGLGGSDILELAPEGDLPFVIFGPGQPAQAHRPDEYIELGLFKRSRVILDRFLEMELLNGACLHD